MRSGLFRGKLLPYLKNPWRVFYRFNYCIVSKLVPDRPFLKLMFRARLGRKLNLNNPKSFNEKMQWIKLYDRNPFYTSLVDKYEVRKFVANSIGNKYLIPILGIYDSFESINFAQLPKKFVIKCTHDSGSAIICQDKSMFDIEHARKVLNKAMSTNFFYRGREWPYKNVKPRLIIEEYIASPDNINGLIDYKLMCFSGRFEACFVYSDRNTHTGLKMSCYDRNWKIVPVLRRYPPIERRVEKPKHYDEMIECAEKLSSVTKFARIDFYEVNGKMYFGEITLFPASGFGMFLPEEYDRYYGDLIGLV